MAERLILILLYLYLLFNLPFPDVVIKKLPKTADEIAIEFEPVTFLRNEKITITGDFDSLRIEKNGYSQIISKPNSFEISLNIGTNDFHLTIFREKKRITKTIQIYRLNKKIEIAVVTSEFNPIFKIFTLHGVRKGNLVIKPFIKADNEWLTLEKNALLKVKSPDFKKFNAIICDKRTAAILQRASNRPICIIEENENPVKFTNTFILSDNYKLRVESITLSQIKREVKDTIIWTEPNKIPVFFLGSDGNFYLNLTNLFELSLKNPEICDSVLNTILENISYPDLKIIKLNEISYLISEPPNLPRNLLLEITKNGDRVAAPGLIKGYLKLTPQNKPDTIRITAKVLEKAIFDTTVTLHRIHENRHTTKFQTRFKMIITPCQSSSLFLILLFIYTALIYTTGKARRQRDENG